MANRVIKSRARNSSLQLSDCLASLLALELISPSRRLYLLSPWISDMALLSSRFGQFRAIMPELGSTELRLAGVLTALAERGAEIRVLCRRGHAYTEAFLRSLPGEVQWRYIDTLHEKGLIGDHFYLRGSMNFTYSGVNLNDESVELTTEPSEIALALAEADQLWELS
ncbi:MAG TPA: phospholipase D-like domain-containing protein DpdK [Herpetosiphonaceae bacterium]|nr:phospholipase D-like domain-containing protein DpdK [Herpetosiphonaceae bacterium]